MFYDELDKLTDEEINDYVCEIVDGKSREEWFANAMDAVSLISYCDDQFDIDNCTFEDFKDSYDSAEWIALHDPEALKHMMGKLVNPVTDIVKQKYLESLTELGYYKVCTIVKDHLSSFPVPAERTFQRKKTKAIDNVKKNLATIVKNASDFLYHFKTNEESRKKLYDENLQQAVGTLLNIEKGLSNMEAAVDSLEWLRENSPKDIEELFSFKICIETKELLLMMIAREELYHLCSYLDKLIKTHDMAFYYEIPPYINKYKDDNFYLDFDDDY